ncbi:MAG: deoxyribodipyrimidine photo-lyase [Fuerstiella sp.]
MQLVWLKRDLRLSDHRPLIDAIRTAEPVTCLYVYEPELWSLPDADARHLKFINESLAELQVGLQRLGGVLVYRVGDITDVLENLNQQFSIHRLLSHEETGNRWTYSRDLKVAAWCRQHNVPWKEHTQNGVIRRLKTRDGWAKRWHRRMSEPLQPAPASIRGLEGLDHGRQLHQEDLKLPPIPSPSQIQVGGETVAKRLLQSFLSQRGHRYYREMSSPVTADNSCSRLSAHLAFGTISMPLIWHAVSSRLAARGGRSGSSSASGEWATSLKAYGERLHWHCHFMQKLEDQPDLEDVDMHAECVGLRPLIPDSAFFEAWKHGRTGYPLIDACMRSVQQTGWLNFRMRAMVVSFAAYHLWLDWRPTSRWLARMFTDYEPGIHYNQFQMQSGTTGISTLRIYNPIKQVADQDPTGIFIRRWVPELAKVPNEHIAEPHRMPTGQQAECECIIGKDYPPPIVDHGKAYHLAKRRMGQLRRKSEFLSQSRDVFQRHGSRRRRR